MAWDWWNNFIGGIKNAYTPNENTMKAYDNLQTHQKVYGVGNTGGIGGAGKSTLVDKPKPTNQDVRIGAGAMAGLGLGPIGGKIDIPGLRDRAAQFNSAPAPGAGANTAEQSAVLEGYLREIQDRLAGSKAVAPTITLNTKPIDSAKSESLKALTNALNSVVGGIEVARNNTKQAYGQAKTDTQGAYDHIVDNSRKEGKKAAKESGDYSQKALTDAASVAMAGINQDMTNSDKLLAEASKSLGGNAQALKEIDKKVDPNDSTGTIRNNISQSFQDQAGNAARQTARDINASSRYADTIASDGASAIADLMAELASRNNQYDRDISDAKSANATNTANIQSTYADKLMQAQLAQQQEQNAVNQSAWQTNVNNDSAALQGMIDLIGSDNKSRLEQELLAAETANKNTSYADRSKYKQVELLMEGLLKNTDKNSVSKDDILEMLKQLQG